MTIHSKSSHGYPYNIDWVYCLQNLEQLKLEISDSFNIDDGVTHLTGLIELRLSCNGL